MYNGVSFPLVEPKVMAIYGVTKNSSKPAALVYHRMKNTECTVIPINPNEKEFPSSLDDATEEVDIAVLTVSSKYLETAVMDCIENDVKVIMVPSADSDEIIKKIYENVDKEKPRVLGPNSLGLYKPDSRLDTIIIDEEVLIRPSEGNVAFVSQSGFLALPIFESLYERSLGISLFADIGSAFDINELDVLEYLSKDEKTDVIALYLEKLVDGRAFFKIVKTMKGKKRIILLKGGRSEGSRKAVQTHTGEMSKGSYSVLEGASEQLGIALAKDERELVDFIIALTKNRFLDDNKIAVLSTTGGMGVIGTDAVAASSLLALAQLSNRTIKAIHRSVPYADSKKNPVDLSPRVDNHGFAEVLQILVEASEVSGVLVYLSVSPNTTEELIDDINSVYYRTSKPVIIVLLGDLSSVELNKGFLSYGIDTYTSTNRAVRILELLSKGAENV